MRRTLFTSIPGLVVAGLAVAAPAAAQPDARIVVRESHRVATAPPGRATGSYQGRSGPEQTERFSRKVRIGRDGRVSVTNISGDIVITAGSGDEVSIEAVKRARGDSGQLGSVRIDVQERGGGVDVQAIHTGRNDRVSVDFTVTVPTNATVDVHSVSGNVKVTGTRGTLRAETVSGDVMATDTPKVETAKSVSGNVTLSGVSTDGDLSAGSVSGNITAKTIKAHGLNVSSVSGDVHLTDAACDRLSAKSVSGDFDYTGSLSKGGSYDINLHSGDVRLTLSNPPGFVLNANSFSGSIHSDLPLTVGGDARDDRDRRGRRESHSMRATYGDGSAMLTIRTFSGDIIIGKR